jgi:hypothetical protein
VPSNVDLLDHLETQLEGTPSLAVPLHIVRSVRGMSLLQLLEEEAVVGRESEDSSPATGGGVALPERGSRLGLDDGDAWTSADSSIGTSDGEEEEDADEAVGAAVSVLDGVAPQDVQAGGERSLHRLDGSSHQLSFSTWRRGEGLGPLADDDGDED